MAFGTHHILVKLLRADLAMKGLYDTRPGTMHRIPKNEHHLQEKGSQSFALGIP